MKGLLITHTYLWRNFWCQKSKPKTNKANFRRWKLMSYSHIFVDCTAAQDRWFFAFSLCVGVINKTVLCGARNTWPGTRNTWPAQIQARDIPRKTDNLKQGDLKHWGDQMCYRYDWIKNKSSFCTVRFSLFSFECSIPFINFQKKVIWLVCISCVRHMVRITLSSPCT